MIDSYQFGEIAVDGRRYTSDVIIFPSRVKSGWWKKEGHEVSPEDLAEVIDERPEVLIVGMGGSGLMRVLPETYRYLEAQGIEIIAQPTDEACQTYNQLCNSRRAVAALHLTC